MKFISTLIYWLGTSLTIFIQLLAYKQLTRHEKFKYSVKNIILILISAGLITYTAIEPSLSGAPRAYISYILMIILENIIFDDDIKKTIIYGTFCYILVVVSEIVLDIFLLITKLVDLQAIDKSVFGKFVFSILMILPSYLIASIEKVKIIASLIEKLFKKSIIWIFFIMLFLIVTLIIAYENISNLSIENYFANIVLLIIFTILVLMIIINQYRINKEINNTKILLDFMSEYEKKIDEDRINRHEMLNNLLILKSYNNKNSKTFNSTLDSFIDLYNKSNVRIKNIYKLPSGLKGIIYYKINQIKNENISININISKQLTNAFEKLNNKTYVIVCKIIGITFDNAIEASIKSKEKVINFEAYEEGDNIVIEIINTFNGKVNLNKINERNYTTKGKGRGLGLYIVQRLVKNNSNINLNQFVDNDMFISQLYIKKPR